MLCFKRLAFEKYLYLETRVRGSLKAGGNDTIQEIAYDFIFTFYSNFGESLYRS